MTARAVIAGRRASGEGGGACTLIVWREAGGVFLSHEGAWTTTAVLPPGVAVELADALRTAADGG